MYYRKWAKRHVPCFLCPGYGGRIGIKVTSEGASPLAQVPVLALGSSLVNMNLLRFCQVCATGIDNVPVSIIFSNKILEIIFYTSQGQRWQKFSIGKIWQSIFIA